MRVESRRYGSYMASLTFTQLNCWASRRSKRTLPRLYSGRRTPPNHVDSVESKVNSHCRSVTSKTRRRWICGNKYLPEIKPGLEGSPARETEHACPGGRRAEFWWPDL